LGPRSALCEKSDAAWSGAVTFGYQIYPEQRVIYVRYSGTFSFERLAATAKTLWGDPRYSRDYHGIVDFLHGPVSAPMADVRKLIELVQQSPHTSRGRWAAVTTAPVATALALVYGQALAQRHAFEVFSSWEAACDFIGTELDRGATAHVLAGTA